VNASSRSWRQRILLFPVALACAAALIAGGGSQALAAPGSPSAAHQVSVHLTMAASASHASTTVALSPAACAAMKGDGALAASARCVMGLGLSASASPDARVRHCGPNGTWTTCYDKGTICGGDSPVWGGKNGSFTCAESYVSVDGRWKYKTPNNKHVWLLGKVACPKYAFAGFSVDLTFCNARNNGHPILTMEAMFNYSGPTSSGNGYIAIYAHQGGKITLYGSWNQ
jgi:hypothetical protein